MRWFKFVLVFITVFSLAACSPGSPVVFYPSPVAPVTPTSTSTPLPDLLATSIEADNHNTATAQANTIQAVPLTGSGVASSTALSATATPPATATEATATLPATPAPPATATLPATATPIPNTATPQPTTIPTQVPTSVPTGQIAYYSSLWGLVPSREGLWIMRPDGSNLTLLTSDPVYAMAVSPNRQFVAYITNPNPVNDDAAQPYGYSLKLFNLVQNNTRAVVSLDMNGAGPNAGADLKQRALFSILAMQSAGLTWSPSGRYLLFSSASGADQAGVMVYDLFADRVRRVNMGPSYPYHLDWAPDGWHLFYVTTNGFGGGPDSLVSGAWVTTIDATQLFSVAQPGMQDERLVSWVTDTILLLASTGPDCGSQNLRYVVYTTGDERIFWKNCFNQVFYNQTNASAYVNISSDLASATKQFAGFFQVSVYSGNATKLTSQPFDSLTGGDMFYPYYGFNQEDGLVGINWNGQTNNIYPAADLPPGAKPRFRLPDGQTWLLVGDGLFLGRPGEAPSKIFDSKPLWISQSSVYNNLYFFFVSSSPNVPGQMLTFDSSTLQVRPFDPNIKTPLGINWVSP